MKKLLLTSFAICSLALSVIAQDAASLQIEKGTGIVSIDLPFALSHRKSIAPNGNYTSFKSFTFKPVISGGYFVARNFMIGGGFGIAKSWSRTRNPSGTVNVGSSPTFAVPSFLMRYYYIFSPKVGFYAQYALEGVFQADGGQPRENGFNMALSPRLVFFPTRWVGLNVGMGELGYGFRAYDVPGDGVPPAHIHALLLEPTIHFGVSFFINR